MKRYTLKYTIGMNSCYFYEIVESSDMESAIHDFSSKNQGYVVVDACIWQAYNSYQVIVWSKKDFRVLYDAYDSVYIPQVTLPGIENPNEIVWRGVLTTRENGTYVKTQYLSQAMLYQYNGCVESEK